MVNNQEKNNNSVLSIISQQIELSLYIHIPFCRQKCSYCNFYSLPVTKKIDNTHSIEKTCQRILHEIDEVNSEYQKPFKTVFIGGGNPGILSKELLENILIKVAENGKPSEITVECNPEDVTDELISLFQKGLATRLSIGVQSLSETLLKKIGRNCSDVNIIRKALKIQNLHSRTWIVNVDLIAGIIGQTLEDVIHDIDEIIEWVSPEHFSIYDLTYEPGTPLFNQYANQLKALQDNNEELLPGIWDYMKRIGYHQYEISNFVRKSDNNKENNFCIHNLQYWEMKPYLGIGPGSASTLFTENTVVRIECEPDTEFYQINSSSLFSTGYSIDILSYLDYMKEKLIMGLRLFSGIELEHFKKIFGITLTETIPKTINRALKQKIMMKQNNWLKFSQDGMMFMNAVLVDMFIELENNLSDNPVHNCLDLTAVFEL